MQMLHVLKLLLGDVHDSQLRAEAPVSLLIHCTALLYTLPPTNSVQDYKRTVLRKHQHKDFAINTTIG